MNDRKDKEIHLIDFVVNVPAQFHVIQEVLRSDEKFFLTFFKIIKSVFAPQIKDTHISARFIINLNEHELFVCAIKGPGGFEDLDHEWECESSDIQDFEIQGLKGKTASLNREDVKLHAWCLREDDCTLNFSLSGKSEASETTKNIVMQIIGSTHHV